MVDDISVFLTNVSLLGFHKAVSLLLTGRTTLRAAPGSEDKHKLKGLVLSLSENIMILFLCLIRVGIKMEIYGQTDRKEGGRKEGGHPV